MTPEAFREICERLGLSYAAMARMLDLNERTPRRWAAGEQPIPKVAAIALAEIDRQRLTPEQIERRLAPYSIGGETLSSSS